jgi:hypothetical protein
VQPQPGLLHNILCGVSFAEDPCRDALQAGTLGLKAIAELIVAHHGGHTFVVGGVTILTHPHRAV